MTDDPSSTSSDPSAKLLPSVRSLLFRTDGPPILYHYTGVSGAIGIIDKQSLWATNILYLNDSEEYRYALSSARRLIGEFRGAHPTHTTLWDTIETSMDLRERETDVHVFSLTAREDQLSQWRAYCRGGGYALGFRRTELQSLMRAHCFFLGPCLYEKADQESRITDCLRAGMNAYDTAKAGSEQTTPRTAAIEGLKECGLNLYILAALLKHPSFCEEEEWRLIAPVVNPRSTIDPRLEFRDKPGISMPIPYLNCSVRPCR